MNPILKQFYETEVMRETVKAFMIAHLEQLAIEQVFSKQAIGGIYEAKKVITNMFSDLEEIYMKDEKVVAKNSR